MNSTHDCCWTPWVSLCPVEAPLCQLFLNSIVHMCPWPSCENAGSGVRPKTLVWGPHLHSSSPCLLVHYQSAHPDCLFQFPRIPWKDTQVPKMKCLAEFQVHLQERQTLCYYEKSLTSSCF